MMRSAPRRRRIRTRLLFWVLFLVLMPLTAVNLVFVLLSFDAGRTQAWRQLSSVASLKENAINTWKYQLSRSVTSIRIREDLDDPKRLPTNAELQTQGRIENLFDELFVVDVKGRVVASSVSSNVGKVLTGKEYFEGLFTYGFVSAPFYDLSRQTLSVMAAAPLRDPEGRITGSLTGVANLSVLDRVMAERTGLGTTGETYLVGLNGSLVTPSRHASRNQTVSLAGVQAVLQGKGTLETTYQAATGTRIATFRWINSLKVALVAEEEQSEAFAPALGILTINLWIECLFVLLAVVSAFLVSRSLTRPLDDLAETARKIADGALDLKAREDGPWEVSQLGQAFNTMTTRLRSSIGELTGYRAHLEELVEVRTKELALAVDKAQESDRLKSAFLATMSHELRTPLNSIIGFTGILSQGIVGPLNDEQKKQLGFVMTSARHLLDLISDILDISKIEAGELKTAVAPFDARAVVDRAVRSIEPLAHKKCLALHCELAPEVGPMTGDARRVEQILLNLLSNAVKFTEAGQIAVRGAVEGGELVMEVEDTGQGIREEDQDKIFRPFQQLDSGLNRLQQGTGLGLSICRRLVELMGGRIEVHSQLGQGTTFRFTLPLTPRSTP